MKAILQIALISLAISAMTAMTAVSMPIPVQAASGTHCYDLSESENVCFTNKKDCITVLKNAQNGISKCYPFP